MPEGDVVIQAKGLVKKFGSFAALDGLDLTVRQGEVHGFLGPNGAGKSTTIRVLLGLLRKTDGELALFGKDPWNDSVSLHKNIAYIPGDVDLWPNLSGGEAIDFLGRLRGNVDKALRAQLIKDFEFDPRKKCGTYSKGNRQKVAIIAALISDVDLYILDEPTSGLDPLMQSVFQSYIVRLKDAGKTILLSSHILAEVEALADQVTIIKQGKVVESGALDDLRQLRSVKFQVETERPVKGLEKISGVHDIEITGQKVVFQATPEATNEILRLLSDLGVRSIISSPPTLDELFMRHYGSSGEE